MSFKPAVSYHHCEIWTNVDDLYDYKDFLKTNFFFIFFSQLILHLNHSQISAAFNKTIWIPCSETDIVI